MAALEPVIVTLLANTAEFQASLDEAKASMAGFGADADLAGVEGDLAGLGATGKQAGTDVADGAGVAAAGLRDTHDAAEDAESGLRDTENATKDVGDAAKDTGGKFNILSNVFGNLPGPLGDVSDKTEKFRGSIESAGESSSGFGSILGSIPVPAVIAGAALAGVAAVSVDLASKYQTVTTQIAASEGITTKAATNVGNAFLTTAGTTTQSAQQIGTAFAAVAGQAKQINGSALSAGQSLGLMKSSIDLAEASSTNLSSATSTLTTTIQAFGLGIKSSPLVSDVLYSAANATGQSVSALGNALDRVKTRLGGMAPPVQQLGGLLVDLTAHGETGRASMQALTTTFTTFLKPATDLATAQNDLHAALEQLPPSLQALGAQVAAGTMTSTQYTAATTGLSASQAALIGNVKTAQAAFTTANDAQAKMGITAVTAKGQLEPMSVIIAQLQDKIKGMDTAQATATLSALGFGNASAKLVATIQAGPAAYDKYVAEVEKTNAAHEAAEKATSGMKDSFEKAKVALEDAGIALGEKLMPYVTEAAQGIAKFAALIVKDWPQISAAFKVAFDIIKPVIVGMIDQIKGTVEILTGLIEFVKDVFTGQWGAAWDAVKKMFDGFVETIKGSIMQMFGPLTSVLQKGIGDIVGFIGRVIGFFVAIPSEVANALGDFFTVAFAALTKVLGWINTNVWTPVSGFFIALPGKVAGLIGDFFSVAWAALTKVVGWLNANLWSPVSTFFSGLPGKVAGVIGDFFDVAWAALTKALGWLDSNVWSPISTFFSGLPGKVAGVITGFYDTAFKDLTNVGQWLETNVWDPIDTFFSGLAARIGKSAGNIFRDITGSAGSFLSGITGGVLAEGGYITSPTLALVGEAGPEVVLPMNNPARIAQILGVGNLGGLPAPSIGAISGVGGGGGGPPIILQVTTPLTVNGQTLAQTVTQYQLRGARSTGTVLGQYGTGQTGTATSINVNAIQR